MYIDPPPELPGGEDCAVVGFDAGLLELPAGLVVEFPGVVGFDAGSAGFDAGLAALDAGVVELDVSVPRPAGRAVDWFLPDAAADADEPDAGPGAVACGDDVLVRLAFLGPPPPVRVTAPATPPITTTATVAAIQTIMAVPPLRPLPWDGSYDLDMAELLGNQAPYTAGPDCQPAKTIGRRTGKKYHFDHFCA
jgi:hypothetical protein